MNSKKALIKRRKKIKSVISGSKSHNRLLVFRSNKHIYAQIIDIKNGSVLISSSDLKDSEQKGVTKTNIAFSVGEDLAKKALKKKIKEVVFDRRGYKYHGRVKSLADGARKGGLIF